MLTRRTFLAAAAVPFLGDYKSAGIIVPPPLPKWKTLERTPYIPRPRVKPPKVKLKPDAND